MIVLGDRPLDLDEVLSLANAGISRKTGAKLEVNFIPLSDFAVKYPLILAGGEGVDLIFAAPWCFFPEGVRKGAFKELTMEFIQKNMPLTYKEQAPVSWKQIAVDGRIFAVPRNESDFDATYGVLVRGDLREKYGIGPLQSPDDFQKYVLAVAAGEKSSAMSAFYINPSFPVSWMLVNAVNNWFWPCTGYPYVWDADEGAFSSETVKFSYGAPEYREYALRMARWAQAGAWPSGAVSGTIHIDDRFKEGKSAATLAHYKNADAMIRDCAAKGMTDVEYYDIYGEGVRTMRSPYSYDSCAILAASRQPERAAAVLDFIKNDREVNELLIGGIKGRHYILGPGNTRTNGPEAADYPWDGWTWCIRNSWNPVPGGMNETAIAVRDDFTRREMPQGAWPCDGFSFNAASVSAELSVINSIITQYSTSFDFGVFGARTAEKLDAMNAALKAAGLDALTREFKKQLRAYTGR